MTEKIEKRVNISLPGEVQSALAEWSERVDFSQNKAMVLFIKEGLEKYRTATGVGPILPPERPVTGPLWDPYSELPIQ